MTDLDPRSGPIPVRVRRLRDVEDDAPDAIAPLAILGMLVATLGSTCLPLTAAVTLAARRAGTGGDAATLPAGPETLDGPTTLTLVGVLVFMVIALIGIAGGVGSILRRQWGRRLMLSYAALVLLYLTAAVTLRFRYGIEGLTATAPTRSALVLNVTCTLGVILAVAVLMVVILRYFSLSRIARRFR